MMNLTGLSASKSVSAEKNEVTFFLLSLYFLLSCIISSSFALRSNVVQSIHLCHGEEESEKPIKVRNLLV